MPTIIRGGGSSSETKTVTPSLSKQTITPTDAAFLESVTVNAVPSSLLGSGCECVCAFNQRYNQNGAMFGFTGLYKDNGTASVGSFTTLTGNLLQIANNSGSTGTAVVTAKKKVKVWAKGTGTSSVDIKGKVYNANTQICNCYRDMSNAEVRLIVFAVEAGQD